MPGGWFIRSVVPFSACFSGFSAPLGGAPQPDLQFNPFGVDSFSILYPQVAPAAIHVDPLRGLKLRPAGARQDHAFRFRKRLRGPDLLPVLLLLPKCRVSPPRLAGLRNTTYKSTLPIPACALGRPGRLHGRGLHAVVDPFLFGRPEYAGYGQAGLAHQNRHLPSVMDLVNVQYR